VTPPSIIKLTTLDGQPVEYVDTLIGQGSIKDVYFSPDKSYVVGFYRQPPDAQIKDRLLAITGVFRERIFNQIGGDYWQKLYCWPTGVVEYQGKIGIVAPSYLAHFRFAWGSKDNDQMLNIRGKEKEGKWFASASNRSRFLDPRELGHWMNHLRIGVLMARAVRRLHAAGLAHSDLSYKNVLVDPVGGNACIIDIDSLVVPGKYPPDVLGTPDFIAPEVVATCHLSRNDPQRKLPSIATDRHALAVLIYLYLLYRHPLRGEKVHDADPQTDETLSMGAKALFVEHPQDASNRINPGQRKPSERPWVDTHKLPYTLTGPYLTPLFNRAFMEGLHDPDRRPTADEWETALVKTVDLLQPCVNPQCEQKWYVFDNTHKPCCPFCATPYQGQLPVLNLYSARKAGNFVSDNHRLMVYSNQSLFPWHVNRTIFPNEKLAPEHQRRVGYFVLHENRWYLKNEAMPELTDAVSKRLIVVGQAVELRDGLQLLLSKAEGGRLIQVQMVRG
jgi:DNA-binding helix-hairpin-helix protein with protein kinase domain